ncbi:MAG: hypothetical protein LBL79_01540 [Prevotella sp.]|nr:hypothetical protein [Prevotella sp.]
MTKKLQKVKAVALADPSSPQWLKEAYGLRPASFYALFGGWVPRLRTKAGNRNATKTRVSLAPYALRAGNPSGEKGVKRDACLSLKGEFSPFSL